MAPQVGSDFVALGPFGSMLRLVFLLWCASAKLLIQKPAPDFVLDAAMPDDGTKTIALSDYKNKPPGRLGRLGHVKPTTS